MNNELTTQGPDMPRNTPVPYGDINQGTVAIESSRAIAEAQGKLVIAKRFPRDEIQAVNSIIKACQRPALADKAFYSYPRGGQTVKGPTIRFAEELARCWGNVDYGIKELSQDDGKSEMQAYAWDLETNTMSTQNFTNPHVREKGRQMERLTMQRDIYEINANMGARRLRARILAIIPADVVDMAVAECEKTLRGDNSEPLEDKIRRMAAGFEKLGVKQSLLEKRLGKPMGEMTLDEFVDYKGIFNSINEKSKSVADWFDAPKEATDLTKALDDELKQQKMG